MCIYVYIWTTTLRNICLIIRLVIRHIGRTSFAMFLKNIQINIPELLVYTYFCDNNNNFNFHSYRRWKDNYMDISILIEHITTSKFKDKLKQDVLEILLKRNHPIYDIIEYEISLM